MQLILDAADIDIQRNMSTIEESLNEKFLENKTIEPHADDLCNGNKENIQKQDNIILEQSEDGVTDINKEIPDKKDEILVDNLSEESSRENGNDTENLGNVEQILIDINDSKGDTGLVSTETVNENENREESQGEKNEVNLDGDQDEAADEKLKNQVERNVVLTDNNTAFQGSVTLKEVGVKGNIENVENITETKEDSEVEITQTAVVKQSVIEIEPKEKESDLKEISKIESDNINRVKDGCVNESSSIENIIEKNSPIEIDDEDEKSTEKDNLSNMTVEVVEKTVEDEKDEVKLTVGRKSPQIDVKSAKAPKKITKTKQICKLSNNLEIFSDEEEEELSVISKLEASQQSLPSSTEKKCISIEDDDDIMVIDEDLSMKDRQNIEEHSKVSSGDIQSKSDITPMNEQCTQSIQAAEIAQGPVSNETDIPEITEPRNATVEESNIEVIKNFGETIEEATPIKEPLVPMNFVKGYKKNLADMSRNELEEFCILKIVESIIDRTNLGDIKTRLKNLTETMDECKNKCLLLTKQNKDLLIVLKSIKEDLKYTPDVHITPLKITRSVGMQVVMPVDKTNTLKQTINDGSLSSGNNNKAVVPPTSQVTRNQKEKSLNNQQIPVPRLVPATMVAKTNQMSPNNSVKQVCNTSLPNGVRSTPPGQKHAEKRSRSQSVTVDLTDDEPPTKLQTVQRNSFLNQALRAGTGPTSTTATQRYGSNINSPRKVYIPISGPQAQNVRPGQTIMLKAITGPQIRATSQVTKIHQNASSVRLGRTQYNKHPAPLPEATKQYQPPNWKGMPPAPDLKLSKVDNGIVISWRIDNYQEENHEEIASYQLYAYQETTNCPVNSLLWKKIGDVKALPLPMACTLTQFVAGNRYYFAVRAVDVRSRLGPFSLPGSILLLNKL